jgi:hypothetical protein
MNTGYSPSARQRHIAVGLDCDRVEIFGVDGDLEADVRLVGRLAEPLAPAVGKRRMVERASVVTWATDD